MTVRSETVAALAKVLDKNEREALLWAAQVGADTADSIAGLMEPAAAGEQARAVGRSLRALLPTLREAAAAAVYDGPPPPTAGPAPMGDAAPRPGPCRVCGMSIAKCDTRIRNGRRACCEVCSMTDTHGDTPSGFAERERARRGTMTTATPDDKTVADRAIARGTLRPRGS